MTPPQKPLRLSKSRFTAGHQCHRQLWWKVYEPEAPELEVDAALQVIFDMGHRVGRRARQEFPGGTLIHVDHRRPAEAVAQTRLAIERGESVIFEASFLQDDIFVAVDVLSREPGGWVLTEVKATSKEKPEHLPDTAIQAHALRKAGLELVRVELMHLNTEHRHPDQGPLFTRADITDAVHELRGEIVDEVRAQKRMLAGALPVVEPGPHCTSPRRCPFIRRCMEPAPEHAIDDLNRISAKKLAELRGEGVETVDQIPSNFPLNGLHQRHRAAVLKNQMIVEPGLQEALRRYKYPIAMLDFETINPALPVWDGCRPFNKVPVQFSVHTLHEDGAVSHRGYLADGEGDPRPAVAKALVRALEGAGTVLAWNVSFENECLGILAESAPEHAVALREARAKTEDLLPVVRNHLYHPEFRGSFSIKTVVPALLPHLAYDELEVADGQTAAANLEALLLRPEEMSAEEREALQEKLVAYCTHDTAVMVELFRYLREVAVGGG